MSRRRAVRGGFALLAAVLLLIVAPVRAQAHGGGDTSDRAADFVHQSLAYLVNQPSDGMDMAEDRMHDALEAPDRDGVDIADVSRAHDSFHAGDLRACQDYLEASLGLRPADGAVPAADVTPEITTVIGAEPGNVFIPTVLDGERNLAGGNLAALVISSVLVACGAALALRTRLRRPREG